MLRDSLKYGFCVLSVYLSRLFGLRLIILCIKIFVRATYLVFLTICNFNPFKNSTHARDVSCGAFKPSSHAALAVKVTWTSIYNDRFAHP